MNKKIKLGIMLTIIIIVIISAICVIIFKNQPLASNKIWQVSIFKNMDIFFEYPENLNMSEGDAVLNLSDSDQNTLANLRIVEAKYNFENFPIESYKPSRENGDIIYENTIDINNITFLNIDMNNTFFDKEAIYSDYSIKYDDIILSIEIFYNNSNTYEEYKNILNNIIHSIKIEDSNDISVYKEAAYKDSSETLFYNQLSQSEKNKYDKIYNKLFVDKKSLLVKYTTDDEYNEYSNAGNALADDLIYRNLENYHFIIENDIDEKEIKFSAKYSKDHLYISVCPHLASLFRNEILNKQEAKKFKEAVDNILNNMSPNLSTYGKYRYLANSISEIAEYAYDDLENGENSDRIYSITGVFVDGKAVCEGYGEAYWYLCRKVGLYCGSIEWVTEEQQENNEQGHAYNCIKLGGKYYFVDTTWMDEDEKTRNFAFVYDKKDKNSHNDYLENLVKDTKTYWEKIKDDPTYPEYESYQKAINELNDLMENLGDIRWTDITQIQLKD